jgi:shikimate kinase
VAHKTGILLIGLRGSGKTTIGRLLAARLGAPFVDLDEVTPGVLGCARVAEAWAKHGEAEFRRAEVVALRRALERDRGAVIALGGGTPIAPGAREIIEEARRIRGACAVYLRATPTTLRARLQQGGAGADRPSLTGADPLDEIETVFAARDEVYRGLADHLVEAAGGADETVDEIVRALGARPA